MTTIKTKADVPDDFVMPPILYSRIVESEAIRNKKTANSSISNPQGNCFEASLFTKVKLSRLGSIRVKGGISSKFIIGQVDEGGLPPYIEHCWVEANGLVYDWSQGKNVIMKKEDWYRMYEIRETEIGIGAIGRFKHETFELNKKSLQKLDKMNCKDALDCILKI
jgi:hypothetical protein